MRTKKKMRSRRSLAAEISYHKKEIAKHRDALRGLIEDATAVVDCCDDAKNALEDAINVLSQYL